MESVNKLKKEFEEQTGLKPNIVRMSKSTTQILARGDLIIYAGLKVVLDNSLKHGTIEVGYKTKEEK